VARHRPTVASEVLRRINRQCRSPAASPGLGRRRPDLGEGLRSFVVERWLIVYRVQAGGVVISRVIDGARDVHSIPLPRR
jgi:toxin ParE1/3/4